MLCNSEACTGDDAKIHTFNTSAEEGRFKLKYLKAPWCYKVVHFSLFLSQIEAVDVELPTEKREDATGKSVGSAEWKTSDFVVTLIKEQQVPVCLSAQAVLFSLRQL